MAEKYCGFMCVAIPTPFRELSTLASKLESLLKDSMNHFAELASAQEFPALQPQSSREQLFGSRELASSSGVSQQNIRRFHK